MKNSSSLTIVTYSEFLSDLIVSTTSFRGEIKVAVVDLTIFLFLSKKIFFSAFINILITATNRIRVMCRINITIQTLLGIPRYHII